MRRFVLLSVFFLAFLVVLIVSVTSSKVDRPMTHGGRESLVSQNPITLHESVSQRAVAASVPVSARRARAVLRLHAPASLQLQLLYLVLLTRS